MSKRRSKRWEIVRLLRQCQISKLLRHRCGRWLPDDEAGHEYMLELLYVMSCGPYTDAEMEQQVQWWMPWKKQADIEALVAYVRGLPYSVRKFDSRAVGERLRLTNAEREQLKLWHIKPFDMTDADLIAQSKAKDRARKMTGRTPRAAYLASHGTNREKPWKAEGRSKASWYRDRRKKGETSASAHRDGKVRQVRPLLKRDGTPDTLVSRRSGLAATAACSPGGHLSDGQQYPKQDRASPGSEVVGLGQRKDDSMGEDRKHEPATAWSELDWASMSQDQVKDTLAAMERDHWARAPEHEARQAKEAAEAEARLLDAFRSHLRQWAEADGHLTMAERNARQREADARL